MFRHSSESYEGNARFEGFTVDLLTRLSKEMNFKFEIVLSPGNKYGSEDPNTGDWGGIVGEVIAGVMYLLYELCHGRQCHCAI